MRNCWGRGWYFRANFVLKNWYLLCHLCFDRNFPQHFCIFQINIEDVCLSQSFWFPPIFPWACQKYLYDFDSSFFLRQDKTIWPPGCFPIVRDQETSDETSQRWKGFPALVLLHLFGCQEANSGDSRTVDIGVWFFSSSLFIINNFSYYTSVNDVIQKTVLGLSPTNICLFNTNSQSSTWIGYLVDWLVLFKRTHSYLLFTVSTKRSFPCGTKVFQVCTHVNTFSRINIFYQFISY